MLASIAFYDIVLWVHVASVVVAFGGPFGFGVLVRHVERNQPRAVPAAYAVMAQLGRTVTGPAAVVALAAGIYMAADRDYFDRVWVTVPLVVLIVVMGLGGGFLNPRSERAAQVAAHDVEAAGHGEPVWSAELLDLRRQLAIAGGAFNVLVLVALFFMVVKP